MSIVAEDEAQVEELEMGKSNQLEGLAGGSTEIVEEDAELEDVDQCDCGGYNCSFRDLDGDGVSLYSVELHRQRHLDPFRSFGISGSTLQVPSVAIRPKLPRKCLSGSTLHVPAAATPVRLMKKGDDKTNSINMAPVGSLKAKFGVFVQRTRKLAGAVRVTRPLRLRQTQA